MPAPRGGPDLSTISTLRAVHGQPRVQTPPDAMRSEMSLDAKLWITEWINHAIDDANPVFGFQQAWDRYLQLVSDR
jgi:hypothetical protein